MPDEKIFKYDGFQCREGEGQIINSDDDAYSFTVCFPIMSVDELEACVRGFNSGYGYGVSRGQEIAKENIRGALGIYQ